MVPRSNELCDVEGGQLGVRRLSFASEHMPDCYQLHRHIFMRKRTVSQRYTRERT